MTTESPSSEVLVGDGELVRSSLINDWFSEWAEICGGQSFCIQVQNVLYREKSEFLDILIFKSETYGNVLVLDGIVNCTERDEFAYQEMMVNLPINCHPNPQNVLIIGGGDGGVAREVTKHPQVQRVVQCEIDQKVIDACRKYLPSMACGFDNDKVQLIVGDGFKFMEEHVEEFDVIITDSSDPIGPAEMLFRKEYYHLLHRALKPGGVICCQGETVWLPYVEDFCRTFLQDISDIFAVVQYAYAYVPSYSTGQIGFILASKNKDTDFREPLRQLTDDDLDRMQLRYYNPDIHRASFVLPQFLRSMLPKSLSVK